MKLRSSDASYELFSIAKRRPRTDMQGACHPHVQPPWRCRPSSCVRPAPDVNSAPMSHERQESCAGGGTCHCSRWSVAVGMTGIWNQHGCLRRPKQTRGVRPIGRYTRKVRPEGQTLGRWSKPIQTTTQTQKKMHIWAVRVGSKGARSGLGALRSPSHMTRCGK